MGVLQPASLFAAVAGGPVAMGLVAAGFGIIGFAAGAWSARRQQGLRVGRVEFIDPREKNKIDDDAAQFRRFAVDTDALPEAQDPEYLLEYFYEDSPIIPNRMAARMARSAPESKDGDGAEPAAAFDVDRCDALLHLALDAYSHPPTGQGYQTQDVEGLPIVTFFDKEIMRAIYTGVLVVTLEGASNLKPASGKGGPVSPYAEVYVNSGSFRTKADKKNANPTWNAKQALFIRNPTWDGLTVDVYDTNRSNDKLGTAVLGLGEMVDSRGCEFRFRLPLRGPAGEFASVTLSCRYLEFAAFDPDEIPEIRPTVPPPAKGKEVKGSPSSRSANVAGMKPAAFVDNKASETQVWLYSNPKERKLVFSFRGTETSQLKDIMTDANLMPCAFKPLTGPADKEKENVSVHRGFNGAYESVRRKLSSLLHAVTTSGGGGDPWDVLVTGHSLGGALATLAAYELASYREHAGNIRSVTLYTYGCPRVGNVSFASDFNKVLSDAWRVTNRRDVVPSVPPSGFMFKFTHVGNPVRLREDGIFYKGVENLKDDIEKDINWMWSLFSFKGVKEHGGDYYQQMLSHGKKLLLQQQQQPEAKSGGAAAAGATATPVSATSGTAATAAKAASDAAPAPAGANR